MKNLIILIVIALSSLTAKAGLREAIIQEGALRGQSLYSAVVAQQVPARAVANAFAYFDMYQGKLRYPYGLNYVPKPGSPGVYQAECEYKNGKCVKTVMRRLLQTMFSNQNYLLIFDLNQPSTVARLHVVNLRTGVVESIFASHGRESSCPNDVTRACHFVSDRHSYASPLGFFMTGRLIYGGDGWEIPLYGLEGGTPKLPRNDLAENIVIHGAWYAEPGFLKKHGYMGRSEGCPALSSADIERWKNLISNGALFYFYHNSLPSTIVAASFVLQTAKK